MFFHISFIFIIIAFGKASKSAFKNKKTNVCVPSINEFEYEGFVYTIIFNTSTVSLKCPISDIVGKINIPSVVIRSTPNTDTNEDNYTQNFTVVKIQSDCFRDQERLTVISLPETITDLGQFAFFNCARLHSMHYPNKMTTVPQSCFYGCLNLESITLPLSIVSIGDFSFFRCELLRYFSLPNSIQSIGAYAFSFCRCISNTLVVPHFINSIEPHSFSNCILIETVRLGNIKRISHHAFYNCSKLSQIIIDTDNQSMIQSQSHSIQNANNNLIHVNTNVFNVNDLKQNKHFNKNNKTNNSNYLSSSGFKIGSNLKNSNQKKMVSNYIEAIDDYAFSYTSINKFDNIYENLYKIGQGSFMHCSKLTSINLTCKLTSITSNCFLNCTSLSQLILPTTLENIENSAFKLCSSLQQIEFPDTITEIGDFAFMQCSRLTSINFPQNLLKIGQSTFALCSKLLIPSIFPPNIKSIGSYAFANCLTKAEQIKLPSSIEKVGNNPFKMSSIESIDVSINNTFFISYQNVLYSAFYTEDQIQNRKKIESNKVYIIDDNNITDQKNRLKSIEEAFALAFPDVPFASINKKTVSFATYSTNEKVEILEGTTKIGIDTFYNAITLQTIVLPSTLNSIDAGAFANSLSLNNISLPPKLTLIGGEAFEYCLDLKGTMYIPPLVTSIGSCAFSCTGIESFEVSEDNYFYFSQSGCLYNFPRTTLIQYPNGNMNRTSFTIPDYTLTIGHSSFYQNHYLEEIIFPSTLTTIEDKAFSEMSSLQNIKMNENLKLIGRYAFSQITTLISIQFPTSIVAIEDNAFLDTPLEYIEFSTCEIEMTNNVFDLSKIICVIFPFECNGSKIWEYFPQDKINNPSCFGTITPTMSPTPDNQVFKLPFSMTVLIIIISGCVLVIAIICISFFAIRNKKKKEKMLKNPNIIESWIIGDPNSTSIDYYTQNKK